MDVPADRSARTTEPRAHQGVREAARLRRRRRPTGEPPPLPHHLQTSGIGWLVAMLVLVAHDRTGGDAMVARLTAGLRRRAGRRAGLRPARSPALPAGRAPGARLQRRALRRVPRRLRDHPDSGAGVQQGRGHGRGSRDPRLHPPASSSPGPSSSAPAAGSSSIPRRAAGAGQACATPGGAVPPSNWSCCAPSPPGRWCGCTCTCADSTATPPQVGGVAGGVARYWASIGRTLAAWGPLGPWATSNSTVWPSFSER
jgi:hypothetical protein